MIFAYRGFCSTLSLACLSTYLYLLTWKSGEGQSRINEQWHSCLVLQGLELSILKLLNALDFSVTDLGEEYISQTVEWQTADR